METKSEVKCFQMKEEIIKLSIQKLQKDGLRFSIDDIAKNLKISKKTIYKYFCSKEELAISIYKTYYENTKKELNDMIRFSCEDKNYKLLFIYYQSYCMIRKEIFNKYALNSSIQKFALCEHEQIWQIIQNIFLSEERKIMRIIVDGTFEKMGNNIIEISQLIHILERMIK